MEETLFRTETGNAFYRIRAPIRPHVSKNLRTTGELMTKQHTDRIQTVVFSGKNVWWAHAVPVISRIQHGFHKIAIRQMVGPMALTLETSSNGIVTERFFTKV